MNAEPDSEARYRSDYRAGKPYAIKRAAKASALLMVAGVVIIFFWRTDPHYFEYRRAALGLLVAPVAIVLGAWCLIDCGRKLRAGQRRGELTRQHGDSASAAG
jgi:hypothetical protein